jgi:dimethylsulfone monooxygenase
VVNGLWSQERFTHAGERYQLKDAICAPKPVRTPRPTVYAGGESEAAKTMIASLCDAYVMHGDEPQHIAEKIADMKRRRESFGLPPMQYGMAAYAIVRDTEAEAKKEVERITTLDTSGTELERELKIQEYSVSNRGLRPRLVGTPEQIEEQVQAFADAGLDLLLLQMSPQMEEMERFSAQVIRPRAMAAE